LCLEVTVHAKGVRGKHIARVVTARDREAAVLRARAERRSFEDIAQELGMSETGARTAYKRALQSRVDPDLENLRNAEELRLNAIEDGLLQIITRDHPMASFGRIVMNPVTGQPYLDDGPKLRAYAELRKVSESRRTLRGADAPIRKVVSVIDNSVVRAELERISKMADELEAELDGEDVVDVEVVGE
jgi:transcriptional regulator with XRE-family HTH domain